MIAEQQKRQIVNFVQRVYKQGVIFIECSILKHHLHIKRIQRTPQLTYNNATNVKHCQNYSNIENTIRIRNEQKQFKQKGKRTIRTQNATYKCKNKRVDLNTKHSSANRKGKDDLDTQKQQQYQHKAKSKGINCSKFDHF